jgi:hypothetical protein
MSFRAPVATCPRLIRDAADEFKDIVGGSYPTFAGALCGAAFGIANFSDIVRYLLFSTSVSALSRFFNKPGLFDKLNRRHRRRVLRLLPLVNKDPARYLWAVDDTLIPKEGRNIWGTYTWHDHNTGGYVHGQRWLVLGLVDRKRRVLVPVCWEILHRKGKSRSADEHRKAWQVALDLIDRATDAGFTARTVVADSWFAGLEFFGELDKREIAFVVEVKFNRKVVAAGRQRGLDCSLKELFTYRSRQRITHLGRPKWATAVNVTFREADGPLRVVGVANKKNLESESFAYYACNRLAWGAAEIWRIARDRWSIEVQFRELKQLFALGGAAARSKEAVETAISLSVIALTVIRFEQLLRVDASEDQYIQPIPAGAIIDEIKLKSLNGSVLALVARESTREKCARRLRHENFGQKPTEEGKKPRIRFRRLRQEKVAA